VSERVELANEIISHIEALIHDMEDLLH